METVLPDVHIVRRHRLKVYAFDVDETLEISAGPVKLTDLMALRNEGHIVGVSGNWAAFVQRVAGWQHLVSFLNAGTPNKETHLMHLKQFVPADDFVMVGNILGVSGASDDQGAAQRVGWRFIKESDFAAGAR
jgi:hypothetical protein